MWSKSLNRVVIIQKIYLYSFYPQNGLDSRRIFQGESYIVCQFGNAKSNQACKISNKIKIWLLSNNILISFQGGHFAGKLGGPFGTPGCAPCVILISSF